MKRVMIALCLVFGSACTGELGHVNLLTTENVSGMPKPIRKGAVGQDCRVQASLDALPSLERAISEAIGPDGDGNALTNVTIYESHYTYVLVNEVCVRVVGDVIRLDSVVGH